MSLLPGPWPAASHPRASWALFLPDPKDTAGLHLGRTSSQADAGPAGHWPWALVGGSSWVKGPVVQLGLGAGPRSATRVTASDTSLSWGQQPDRHHLFYVPQVVEQDLIWGCEGQTSAGRNDAQP